MNTLAALKRSALGLDFYLWLNYRIFALRAPLLLSWPSLYRQFGTDPTKASDKRTVDAFRTDSLRELKKIKLAWPDLHYATAKGVLILYPSTPAIAPTTGPQRLAWVAPGASRSVRSASRASFPAARRADASEGRLVGLSTDRCDSGEFSTGKHLDSASGKHLDFRENLRANT